MDPAEKSFQTLHLAYSDYKQIVLPRIRGLPAIGDIDTELFEEDAYLAGLVDSFLKGRQVDEMQVNLDLKIDLKIQGLLAASDTESQLEEIKAYRGSMQNLASLLRSAIAAKREGNQQKTSST